MNLSKFKSEKEILKLSIFTTIFLAILGLIFGLLASSATIIFDSIYGMIDALMTILALVVAKLITASTSKDIVSNRLEKHFTMGFWHLEPIVLGVNGILLIGASIYAFINAIDSILLGGREIIFSYAIIITAISIVVEITLGVFIRKANKDINSEFLKLNNLKSLVKYTIDIKFCQILNSWYYIGS